MTRIIVVAARGSLLVTFERLGEIVSTNKTLLFLHAVTEELFFKEFSIFAEGFQDFNFTKFHEQSKKTTSNCFEDYHLLVRYMISD